MVWWRAAISNSLNKDNYEFYSLITTNAYLFDQEKITKAQKLWNLKYAQITLDGTEEIYNRVKNYVYNTIESPYKKVLTNIDLLLKSGISVGLQINLDKHNFDDAYALINELENRFSKYENFKIYLGALLENAGSNKIERTPQDKKLLWKNFFEIEDYLFAKNLYKIADIDDRIITNLCIANNDSKIIILPDGKLAKCDLEFNNSVIGNIYSEKLDLNLVNKYKLSKTLSENCLECAYLPKCNILMNCPEHGNKECDIYRKEYCLRHLRFSIIDKFRNYISRA